MPKQKPLKWSLPDVVHPPDSVCFQINVPNNLAYIGAFYGAMFLLTKPYAWADDAAHTALEVGAVWRDIFYNLVKNNCSAPVQIIGGGGDEEMAIRQNPDNPCEIQSSQDGIHWCTFIDLSLCTPKPNQPGDGAPQPSPGGGCQTYHGVMGANKWYLPTVVNTGDTILISGATGAWNDGAEIAWRCHDGGTFFAGKCTGITALDGADPLPTEPHMCMIAEIDGSFYNISSGLFTVPGGVTNASVTLQANDSTLTDDPGNIEFDVTVCNNQAASWTHVFEFATDAFGWAPYDTGGGNFFGMWNPGFGWDDTDASNSGLNARGVAIARSFASRDLTGVVMEYDYTTGSVDSGGFVIQNVADNITNYIVHHLSDVVAGTDVTDSGSASSAAQTVIRLQYLCDITAGARSGSVRLRRLTLSGLGSDPF